MSEPNERYDDTWIAAFAEWFRIAFERVAAARTAYRQGNLDDAVDFAVSAAEWCKLAHLASEHLAGLYRTLAMVERMHGHDTRGGSDGTR